MCEKLTLAWTFDPEIHVIKKMKPFYCHLKWDMRTAGKRGTIGLVYKNGHSCLQVTQYNYGIVTLC